MENILRDFRSRFLPHVMFQRKSDSNENFGCAVSELKNEELKKFVEQSELLTDWLANCIPRKQGTFRLGRGCDPKSVDELDRIYGESGAIPDLVGQRIFIFAEDGSGWPYCINIGSGEVFRAWGAWGGSNDRELEKVIDQRWDSLADFTTWLIDIRK